MKKLFIIILLSSSVAFAGDAIVIPNTGFNLFQQPVIQPYIIEQPAQPVQKYNPYENRHETVYPDAQLKYNPYENRHEYTRPDAVPVYNPYENKYEFPK